MHKVSLYFVHSARVRIPNKKDLDPFVSIGKQNYMLEDKISTSVSFRFLFGCQTDFFSLELP